MARGFSQFCWFQQRIMVNLIQNAVQAMPKGGNLTLSASNQKRQVTIVIEDTGEGIPEEVRGKLFTPLMITKSKARLRVSSC